MRVKFADMTLDQLIERFIDISIAQGKAMAEFQNQEYNRLFNKEAEILSELKTRNGDQRRALFALYTHPNIQVRLNAAKSTYAFDPESARAELQAIVDSKHFPWAGDAGMTLALVDAGIGRLD